MFRNKTVFITGASRGIGKAIALRLASDGANIVIAAKSVTEDPRLGGTIYSAAEEVKAAGGQALAVVCDIRDEEQVSKAVEQAVSAFGAIDFLVNNASAINLTPITQIEMKRYDLMQSVNVRGTMLVSKLCIPHLIKSGNGHILTLSPPVNLDKKWFKKHTPYTISKYGMTMVAMGLSGELSTWNVASNTLWPATTIATAAVKNLLGGDALIQQSRKPEIVADAAFYVLSQPVTYTGHCLIDEQVLAQAGITDLEQYNVTPGGPLFPDLFL